MQLIDVLISISSNSEQNAQQSLTRERPQDRHVAYVVEAGANARDRQVGGRHVGATGPGLNLWGEVLEELGLQ